MLSPATLMHVCRHWNIKNQAITFAIYVYGPWKWVALGMTNGGLTGADLWMARSDDAQPWWVWTSGVKQ